MLDLDFLLTPRMQGHIFASGLLAILTLGTLSLILLAFVALWAVVSACATIVLSVLSTLAAIQVAYSTLNPVMQSVALLICLGVPSGLVARRLGILSWRTR